MLNKVLPTGASGSFKKAIMLYECSAQITWFKSSLIWLITAAHYNRYQLIITINLLYLFLINAQQISKNQNQLHNSNRGKLFRLQRWKIKMFQWIALIIPDCLSTNKASNCVYEEYFQIIESSPKVEVKIKTPCITVNKNICGNYLT